MTLNLSEKNFDGYFIAFGTLLAHAITERQQDFKKRKVLLSRVDNLFHSAMSVYNHLSASQKEAVLMDAPPEYQYLFQCIHRESDLNSAGGIGAKIFRKVRGGVRCYKEHGFRYTAHRFLEHLTGKA